MSPKSVYKWMLFFIIILGQCATAPHVHCQTIKGYYKLQSPETDTLLKYLKKGNLQKVSKRFFGETYDDELPDLLMFIDETQKNSVKTNMALLKGDKRRDELFGERFLYVLVFWAIPDSNKAKTGDSAIIKLTALDQKMGSGEFALFTALKAVAAVFSKQDLKEKNEKELCEHIQFKIKKVNVGTVSGTTLLLAFGKLPLQENTINRVHVQTTETDSSPIYLATFGNYSPSWVTSSIGLLVSSPCCCGEKENYLAYPIIAPFLFGHLYIYRPQCPKPRLNNARSEWWRQLSVSLAVGTNLSDKMFEDLFIGGSLGHVLNKLGLVAGVTLKAVKDEDATKRICHLSCGVTFIL